MRAKTQQAILVSFLCAAIFSAMGCSAQGEQESSASALGNGGLSEESAAPQYQIGPWGPYTYNIEEPYINVFHASQTRWSCGELDTAALYAEGYLDRRTGLPTRLPSGCTLTTQVFFTVPANTGMMPEWDGEWILEFETADGVCRAQIGLLYFPGDPTNKRGDCRIEFTRDAANGKTPYHMAIQVKRLPAPMTALRMFRAENAADVQSGKIWNPRFVDAVAGYDVIRTMDLQEANRATPRTLDEIASLDAAQWGNIAWQSGEYLDQPFLGPPLEAVFALGVEAGTALWVHAPITLGSSVDIFDLTIHDRDLGRWLDNITAEVKRDTPGALASAEWDRYAKAFTEALISSGYPADRPLYVTLANEVWNYAGQYNYTTRYAGGLGAALGGDARTGYGTALAKFKLALDAALARAGREQALVYVVEGQAANPGTTSAALAGARSFLSQQGEAWEAHASDFGVSVASYWGAAPDHLKRDRIDPNDLAALENWFINGPAHSISTLKWNLAQWRAHANEAAKFGVPFIGAYEGGSHFEKPAEMDEAAYEAFLWGEAGGRVNSAVNEALADAFPGAILSNYVLAGATGGQPWFEGPLGAENPYQASWPTGRSDAQN